MSRFRRRAVLSTIDVKTEIQKKHEKTCRKI